MICSSVNLDRFIRPFLPSERTLVISGGVSGGHVTIEKAFAKLKALLRKAAERTVEGLWDAIGRFVDLFSPQECANYFVSCGYDAD